MENQSRQMSQIEISDDDGLREKEIEPRSFFLDRAKDYYNLAPAFPSPPVRERLIEALRPIFFRGAAARRQCQDLCAFQAVGAPKLVNPRTRVRHDANRRSPWFRRSHADAGKIIVRRMDSRFIG
jgi:hypothetical protein